MRILHLASEYPPAPVYGLGRYVHELAEAQASLDHHVEVFTNSLGGNEHQTIRNGVTIKRVHTPPPPKAPATSAMLLHFCLQLVERVLEEKIAGAGQFEVVNAHDWLTVPAGFHISRLLKIPLVTTVHDVIFNKARHREFNAEDAHVAGVENWACHVSSQIVVLSESIKSEVCSSYHADPKRVAVVPGGVGIAPLHENEFEHVAKWRAKVAPADADVLLYAGRFEPEKGIFTMLDAVRSLLNVRPKGWCLVLAGKGQLQGAIEKKVAKLGLNNHVALLGYLDLSELRTAYAAADVLIVPSEYEPFGLVALEGQRVGTPVIVSDVGGLAETLRKTEGGLTFPSSDPAALCGRIIELLNQPNLRRELGLKAKRNAQQFYEWKPLAQQLNDVYEIALKNSPVENAVSPQWIAPKLIRPAIRQQTANHKTAVPNPAIPATEQFELRNLAIIWSTRNVKSLKPLLERLTSAHALNALQGTIQVALVAEPNEGEATPLQVDYPNVTWLQPHELITVWSSIAVVIAPRELQDMLRESGILDASKCPTIWMGRGDVEFGQCVSKVDDVYALVNKLLCDDYLRNAFAPGLTHKIAQLQPSIRERAKPLILHVLPQLVTGGAETTLLELIKGIATSFNNEILCIGPSTGPLPKEFQKLGCEISQSPVSRDKVLKSIAAKNPDVIHLHSMSYVPHWIPVHRHLAEWNVIETEHVVNIGSGHFGRVGHVVCVSSAVRDAHRKYERAWQSHGSNYSVIYNGIDAADFSNLPDKATARTRLKLPQDRRIAGRVSALARNKCTEEAIDGIAHLVKIRPDIVFVIVGDGPQRPDVEQWIAARGLQDHVRMLGERRDVPLILRALDMFAYHTPKEALGNVILEALAAGLPVVCSHVEGTQEALHGSQGELVPNGNPAAFAKAVCRWLDRKKLKPNTLPDKFTRARMCDAYSNLYKTALTRPENVD